MRTFICAVFVFCLLAGHVAAADIIQGRCISMENDAYKMTVEIYDTRFTRQHPYGGPTGRILEMSIKGASMDSAVRAGSLVRVAYEIDGTRVKALKIMSLPDIPAGNGEK